MDVKKLMNQSFLTRTISGVVLVILLLVTGLVGGEVLYAATFAVSVIGVGEMLDVMGLKKSIAGYFAYAATIIYYFMIYVTQTEYTDVFIIGYMMVILAVYVFTYPKYKTEEILLTFFSVLYAAVLMAFIWLVREGNDGLVLVWLIFLSSWGCDTCAYLTGVTCGKHKMAPVLSPKKSVEGGIGGVAGAALLGALYGFLMKNQVSFDSPVLVCAMVCFAGAFISMIGDLAASAIKRNYGIKDYGKLIPGHGGILDRFDSVLFTAPVIYYLTTIFVL